MKPPPSEAGRAFPRRLMKRRRLMKPWLMEPRARLMEPWLMEPWLLLPLGSETPLAVPFRLEHLELQGVVGVGPPLALCLLFLRGGRLQG